MTATARKAQGAVIVRERRVRGRPMSELGIEVLRAELARALDTIDDLRDTIRLHNSKWSDGLNNGNVAAGSVSKGRPE